MTYQETLQYLYQLQIKGMKFGLSSMLELLSLLDDPHRHLKTVHVGGTNGKGSTCAMLASCLQHAGFKVGLYTSPHLIDFTERIVVNSNPISQTEVIRLTGHIQGSMTHTPTFFELTTAMAFLYFLEQKVDIAVIEVGLGGRLDSTNVLTPLLSIITNIDLDHQDYLGNTLLEIGFEKAGIIKKEVPLISGISQKEVQNLVFKSAESLNAPVYQLGVDFNFISSDSSTLPNAFHYQGIEKEYFNLSTSLLGDHQKSNASLALTAFEILHEKGFPHTEKDSRVGLESVHWPGRIEIIQKNPLIILDGAHNPSGATILFRFLQKLPSTGTKFLVLGMMRDKDIYKIGEALFPWPDEIILTKASIQRSALPGELLRNLPPTGKPVHLIESIPEVFQFFMKRAKENDQICFTGSLYTIGEVKATLEGVYIDVPLHG